MYEIFEIFFDDEYFGLHGLETVELLADLVGESVESDVLDFPEEVFDADLFGFEGLDSAVDVHEALDELALAADLLLANVGLGGQSQRVRVFGVHDHQDALPTRLNISAEQLVDREVVLLRRAARAVPPHHRLFRVYLLCIANIFIYTHMSHSHIYIYYYYLFSNIPF